MFQHTAINCGLCGASAYAEVQEFCTKARGHNRRINDTSRLSPNSEQFFTFCVIDARALAARLRGIRVAKV
jgi:hypothetical protein